MLMEKEPDTDNVVYLDEYPHLNERARLRRMGQLMLFAVEPELGNLVLFELPEPPDGAA